MSKKPSIQDLQQQVGDLTEALQRERADAMNVRRRAEEDKLRLAGFYKATILGALLPALDNLERALKHAPTDIAEHDYVKGVQGVVKQFDKSLDELGVSKIKTVGEIFNPKYHEAVHMEDGEGDKEVVAEELASGYAIGDEVIRHAMVKVRKEK